MLSKYLSPKSKWPHGNTSTVDNDVQC